MLNGQRVIDMHAHTVAPPELYAAKAGLLSGRGYHGKSGISEERIEQFAQNNLKIMDKVQTDVQFLSPRPFQLMHSEKPEVIVHWWCEMNNDVIASQVKAHPDRFQGICGLPHVSGAKDSSHVIPELERCVNELGFIGCLINPDPEEGQGDPTDPNYTPPMDHEYWFPLYEAMEKLDVPGLIHSAACKNPHESYSAALHHHRVPDRPEPRPARRARSSTPSRTSRSSSPTAAAPSPTRSAAGASVATTT